MARKKPQAETTLLLEGTDGKVHFIYHAREITDAWAGGRLRPNSFVRLRRAGPGQDLGLVDLGDADKLLTDKQHFLSTAARLLKRGILPTVSTTIGWLGRYHQELDSAAERIATLKERPHQT